MAAARERHEAGTGEMARARRSALREAAKAAFQGDTVPRAWERRIAERQAVVRRTYLDQARLLSVSTDPQDRHLGAKVEAFVQSMAPAGQPASGPGAGPSGREPRDLSRWTAPRTGTREVTGPCLICPPGRSVALDPQLGLSVLAARVVVV